MKYLKSISLFFVQFLFLSHAYSMCGPLPHGALKLSDRRGPARPYEDHQEAKATETPESKDPLTRLRGKLLRALDHWNNIALGEVQDIFREAESLNIHTGDLLKLNAREDFEYNLAHHAIVSRRTDCLEFILNQAAKVGLLETILTARVNSIGKQTALHQAVILGEIACFLVIIKIAEAHKISIKKLLSLQNYCKQIPLHVFLNRAIFIKSILPASLYRKHEIEYQNVMRVCFSTFVGWDQTDDEGNTIDTLIGKYNRTPHISEVTNIDSSEKKA